MELKPGYKQTEVGVIPEDWDILPFEKLAHIERGKFTARPRNDPKYYGGDIPFIQTGDVTNANGQITTYSQTLNAQGLKVSKLFPRGTLFFTIAANIGDVGFAAFDTACPDSLVAITSTPATDKTWLSYELAKRKALFESIATHNAQLNINLEKLRPYLLPRPPLPEQRSIATALSDMDELLGGLDRLITKKRDLKQSAMQQLLTGKKRLTEFDAEWEMKRLGELAPLQRGFDLPNSQLNLGPFPVVYSNGILTYHTAFKVHGPGIVTGRSGTIGKVTFVEDNYWPHNTSLWVTNFKGSDPKFIFYLYTWLDFKRFATGSGVPTLNRNDVHSFEVLVPSTAEEQTAIASILSDMDTEIATLEQRRNKTHDLKQAMMQELLTGRIRLL
jgi:type I restriction enzyme, S subunit